MTNFEQEFLQRFPKEMQKNAVASFDYVTALNIVNARLKDIFGERANWNNCLKKYYNSYGFKNSCRSPSSCEEIPTVTVCEIHQMLEEEKKTNAKIEKLQQIRNSGFDSETEIIEAAQILGLVPDCNDRRLTENIIDFADISKSEVQQIEQSMHENIMSLKIAVDMLSSYYIEGYMVTFPYVGTMVTQRKGKYYFRGENAYYGASRPSLYRTFNSTSSNWVNKLVGKLKIDMCGYFLDQFDAIKKWPISNINYLALAQHYGLRTPMMDLTSNLMTALFFMCCKFEDNKWHPLTKSDIEHRNSRSDVERLGGDSRFGILYRTPTDINDMKWVTENYKSNSQRITPIGYQPFMRCSSQNGYMLLISDEGYDMLRDNEFEKFKVELTEDFCNNIFDEMERGDLIYPQKDVLGIYDYMNKINKTTKIPQSIFNQFVCDKHLSDKGADEIKSQLLDYGYRVVRDSFPKEVKKYLKNINRNYTVQKAIKFSNVAPVSRAMVYVPGEAVVDENNNLIFP